MNETRSAAPSASSDGLQQLVARQIVGDEIAQMQALRRGIFDVAHVEIKPAAIEQKSAIARRLFVIPIVQIDRPGVRLAEEVILYLGRPERRR